MTLEDLDTIATEDLSHKIDEESLFLSDILYTSPIQIYSRKDIHNRRHVQFEVHTSQTRAVKSAEHVTTFLLSLVKITLYSAPVKSKSQCGHTMAITEAKQHRGKTSNIFKSDCSTISDKQLQRIRGTSRPSPKDYKVGRP